MTLADYITHVGDEAAAAEFGVEVRTAASWRRGERSPRPRKAAEIIRVSGGRFAFDDIYPPQRVTG